MPLKNSGDDRIVLGGVSCPVNLRAKPRGVGLELFEVFIQPRHRVQLDPRGDVARSVSHSGTHARLGRA